MSTVPNFGSKMLFDFLTYLKTQKDYSSIVALTPDPNLHKESPFDKLISYYKSLGFTPNGEKSIDYIAEIDTIQSNILSKIGGKRRRKSNKKRKSNKRRRSNKWRRSNKRVFNKFL